MPNKAQSALSLAQVFQEAINSGKITDPELLVELKAKQLEYENIYLELTEGDHSLLDELGVTAPITSSD